MIQRVVNKVTDEQVRSSPIKGVNTIAWLLWHMARAEDLAVNRFVAQRYRPPGQ
jgi:DinB superfamily